MKFIPALSKLALLVFFGYTLKADHYFFINDLNEAFWLIKIGHIILAVYLLIKFGQSAGSLMHHYSDNNHSKKVLQDYDRKEWDDHLEEWGVDDGTLYEAMAKENSKFDYKRKASDTKSPA